MTVYGQMIDGAQVEEAVAAYLKLRLPYYLAEVAEQRGLQRGDIPSPRTWTFSPEFNLDETTQLPAILILSSGIGDAPSKEGDGRITATWIVGVAVVVSAGGDDPKTNTNRLAKRYAAAIRGAMMQHPTMETENMEVVAWSDEAYEDVPSEQTRSLASARLVFSIDVKGVMNVYDGPIFSPDDPELPPDPDPTDPWPDNLTVRDPDSDPQYNPVSVRRTQ